MNRIKLRLKKLCFFFTLSALVICGGTLRAQTAQYTLDGTLQGVQYFHAIVSCNGENVVLLKFINGNTNPVSITWSQKFSTQQMSAFSPNPAKGPQTLTLQPGSTSPADCQDQTQPACVIDPSRVHPAYKAHILDFQFYNVSVN